MGLHSTRAKYRSSRVLPSPRGSQTCVLTFACASPSFSAEVARWDEPLLPPSIWLVKNIGLGTLLGVIGLASLPRAMCSGLRGEIRRAWIVGKLQPQRTQRAQRDCVRRA